ncbi:MAG: RsmB/NOP family class I SAM-dependent RNA methyltransferase [Alphaproteobacteria bacterium]|nr:RsmB/NOP family class I SAM-dependent RNA methyltransferase [Alphaproteobacteria bacterium]
MTPSAHLQSAIDALQLVLAFTSPADAELKRYMKNRRYIGAKDRSEITRRVYHVLRHKGSLAWWITQGGGTPTPRALALMSLRFEKNMQTDSIAALCDGSDYAPAPLTANETRILESTEGKPLAQAAMPDWDRMNYPRWMDAQVKDAFGEHAEAEMSALHREATTDIRVNTLHADREAMMKELQKAGMACEPTLYSPIGLRLSARLPLHTLPVFKQGWFEIQDEASQLAAQLAGAKPGQKVIDLCAGAGGKSLAIAACMKNEGRLLALDTSEPRITECKLRMRRAGVHNGQTKLIASESDDFLKRHRDSADLVVLDVPCTGTGTWRRNPDLLWRYGEKNLEQLRQTQQRIFAAGAKLVKPGGRLAYLTCSFLNGENEDQVSAFLNTHPAFEIIPVATLWHDAFGTPCPITQDALRLSPAAHHCDGFFGCYLQRKS